FAVNPKLVVTKIQEQEPELCAVARSGLMSLTGHPGQAPAILGGHVPSLAVGIYVAVAAAAALLTSKKTGKGSIATVSVREALESFEEQGMLNYRLSGKIPERRESTRRFRSATVQKRPLGDQPDSPAWPVDEIHGLGSGRRVDCRPVLGGGRKPVQA